MNTQQAAMSGASIADKKIAVSTGLLALALGSGLGATQAEAKLIVTPLDLTVQAGQTQDFGPVGDEFTFSNFGIVPTGGLMGIGLQGNATALSTNFVAIKAGGGSPPLLDFFGPGTAVDSSLTFGTQGVDFFFQGNNGLVKPANNVVYGLETVGAADQFGFLQLDILPNTDVHLDLFAFENTPGAAAAVIPEPGTLSLFAVGGAALLAARRRKKQPKAA